MTNKKVGVGIIGGTGYGAHELLRLLAGHPSATLVSCVSRSQAGTPIAAIYPDLATTYEQNFSATLDKKKLQSFESQVIFTALPHGVSIEVMYDLLQSFDSDSLHIIDLSGDLRLKNKEDHQRYYPDTDFAADIRDAFVYGLSELNREAIKEAQHIANPGCYPTATTLALAPLIQKEIIQESVIINAASGSSGAGRATKDSLHHPQRNASMLAYSPLMHRHEPEIRQALALPDSFQSVFVPHLLPITRGIYITAYATLKEPLEQERITEWYRDFYADERFIRVRSRPPELVDVVGSNYCDIHIAVRDSQIVVMAVEDNLVKGMAGQAIQNMNLVLGIQETAGLLQAPLGLL